MKSLIRDFYKKFLIIFGELYEDFGYSVIQGWIEALLILKFKELTQTEISQNLSEIMSDEDAPTSISSVNRGLKDLEKKNVVIKLGSRKKGYRYRINPKPNAIGSFIKNFIINYKKSVNSLKELKESMIKSNDEASFKIIDLIDLIVKKVENDIELFTEIINRYKIQ